MARRGKSRPKPRPKRIPVRAAVDGSELCLQCGMCCDGTLFSTAGMEAGEQEFVESLGLVVEAKPDGGLALQLPCHHLVDGCCSLYTARRPAVCGSYRCELLTRYVAGTRSLDEVLPVVHLVRSLVRELEVEMGIPAGGYTRRVLQRYVNETKPGAVAPGTGQVSPEHVRFLVAFSRLYTLGVKYFGWEPLPAEEETAAAGVKVAADVAAGSS